MSELGDLTTGNFSITDLTTYPERGLPSRAIRVWVGNQQVGKLAEYPTAETRFIFTPERDVAYGTVGPVADALRAAGVYVEGPSDD